MAGHVSRARETATGTANAYPDKSVNLTGGLAPTYVQRVRFVSHTTSRMNPIMTLWRKAIMDRANDQELHLD